MLCENVVISNQSIQSIFICSKCPEIITRLKGFSIASRTTRLRPALTAAQLINYTMKEKEKLDAIFTGQAIFSTLYTGNTHTHTRLTALFPGLPR